MSCRFCAIWRKNEDYDWHRDDNAGMCTLNPVWVETNDQHFCSHFLMAVQYASESTLMFENNRALHAAKQLETVERKRRIAAEKTSKQLRQQIKALKQQVRT